MKHPLFIALAAVAMAACGQKAGEAPATETDAPQMADCDITLDGIRFTKSLNGAESQVTDSAGVVVFKAKPHADFFRDPNDGKLSKNDAAILFTEVDNTKPFTFSAKTKAGFTPEGTYNAAVLFVYANDTLWQKLCYEQDERGNHRVVTVRTIGTSDDNNHDAINQADSVYFKISSDSRTIASYYSLDGQTWQMVRLYKNSYGDKLLVGICSQAAQVGRMRFHFREA